MGTAESTTLREQLKRLDTLITDNNQRIGRWQMYKQVLELTAPIAHLLPPAYCASLARLDPDASP